MGLTFIRLLVASVLLARATCQTSTATATGTTTASRSVTPLPLTASFTPAPAFDTSLSTVFAAATFSTLLGSVPPTLDPYAVESDAWPALLALFDALARSAYPAPNTPTVTVTELIPTLSGNVVTFAASFTLTFAGLAPAPARVTSLFSLYAVSPVLAAPLGTVAARISESLGGGIAVTRPALTDVAALVSPTSTPAPSVVPPSASASPAPSLGGAVVLVTAAGTFSALVEPAPSPLNVTKLAVDAGPELLTLFSALAAAAYPAPRTPNVTLALVTPAANASSLGLAVSFVLRFASATPPAAQITSLLAVYSASPALATPLAAVAARMAVSLGGGAAVNVTRPSLAGLSARASNTPTPSPTPSPSNDAATIALQSQVTGLRATFAVPLTAPSTIADSTLVGALSLLETSVSGAVNSAVGPAYSGAQTTAAVASRSSSARARRQLAPASVLRFLIGLTVAVPLSSFSGAARVAASANTTAFFSRATVWDVAGPFLTSSDAVATGITSPQANTSSLAGLVLVSVIAAASATSTPLAAAPASAGASTSSSQTLSAGWWFGIAILIFAALAVTALLLVYGCCPGCGKRGAAPALKRGDSAVIVPVEEASEVPAAPLASPVPVVQLTAGQAAPAAASDPVVPQAAAASGSDDDVSPPSHHQHQREEVRVATPTAAEVPDTSKPASPGEPTPTSSAPSRPPASLPPIVPRGKPLSPPDVTSARRPLPDKPSPSAATQRTGSPRAPAPGGPPAGVKG